MSLRDWQSQLSQALLLPEPPGLCQLTALQGLEGRRLALYEELMFNTVVETLGSIYPYCYRLISRDGQWETDWSSLVEAYRRAYPNVSYKLMGAVSSFPEFLAGQCALLQGYPFLPELALYEWLEMQVLNLPDSPIALSMQAAVPSLEQWDAHAPVWNLARQLQAFQFHIPEILEAMNTEERDFQAATVLPKPVDILIYRDPQTLEVRFFCLNGLTAQLMQLSDRSNHSYSELMAALLAVSPVLQAVPAEIIRQQLYALFQTCLQNGMLLGSMPL